MHGRITGSWLCALIRYPFVSPVVGGISNLNENVLSDFLLKGFHSVWSPFTFLIAAAGALLLRFLFICSKARELSIWHEETVVCTDCYVLIKTK